jgi:hypothetical protein
MKPYVTPITPIWRLRSPASTNVLNHMLNLKSHATALMKKVAVSLGCYLTMISSSKASETIWGIRDHLGQGHAYCHIAEHYVDLWEPALPSPDPGSDMPLLPCHSRLAEIL